MAEKLCGACGKAAGADGKMHFIGEKWVCSYCKRGPVTIDTAKTNWPMVTNHIDGKPTVVHSLRHLRQLENRHGIQNYAYNYNNPERRDR